MPEQSIDNALNVIRIGSYEEFPDWIGPEELASFLYRTLKPYNDELPDVRRGIDDALSADSPLANYVLLAERDEKPIGAVVMLKTGMRGYIPENLLLFIAVEPACRGQGIGKRLLEQVQKDCEGEIKLHVEYDNPAKRLYERVGFVNKYAEMRYTG